MTINAKISVNTGNCGAAYTVAFTVSNPPGGTVNIDYSWHLADERTVTPRKTVTLQAGTTSFTDYISSRAVTGRYFVSWVPGVGSPSNSMPVTIFCNG